jgi:hypothetical protein
LGRLNQFKEFVKMSRDLIIEKIRQKLTENKIKFWTAPYYVDGTPVEVQLEVRNRFVL